MEKHRPSFKNSEIPVLLNIRVSIIKQKFFGVKRGLGQKNEASKVPFPDLLQSRTLISRAKSQGKSLPFHELEQPGRKECSRRLYHRRQERNVFVSILWHYGKK